MGEVIFDDVSIQRWPLDSPLTIFSYFDVRSIFLKIEKLFGVYSRNSSGFVLIDDPLDCPSRALAGVEPTFESNN